MNGALIIGSFFILTALICNEWTLASLFSVDGTIATSRKIVIRIFDLLMIAAGISFFIRKKSLDIKRVFHGLITFVLLIFIIETGLHTVNYFIHSGDMDEPEDKRYLLLQFEQKPWAKDLFKEFEELSGGYREFRGWGKNEYNGKYVNINSDGVRKTWNPDGLDESKSKKIYVFGGSLTWSESARDDYTIPSFISKKLHEKGYEYLIYNYGEWAYTNTQAIIYLSLLLRDGHRPDYVFLYGGTDVITAYQSGKLGTLSLTFLESEKEISDIQHIWIGASNLLAKYSMIYKELIKINRKLDPPDSKFQEVAHFYNDEELQELGKGVIDYLEKSLIYLDNLSKAYGFKYIFFWPPSAFTEEKLLDEETNIDERMEDESMRKLYMYTQEYLEKKTFPHFYNLTDALKGRNQPYYLDFGHITEEGNELISSKIISIFESEYLSNGSERR